MFCAQCGTELPDGAKFCPKCGAKLIGDDMQQQAAASTFAESMQQMQQQSQDITVNTPKKKKSGKLWIGLGAAVIVIIAAIIIALNWNGKIDYIATVSAHTPFADSQGLPYTYGEVLNKYISSPEWVVRESDDVHYVDISGEIKGMDNELLITIEVTQDPNDPDIAIMTPESVTLDDIKSSTENEAVTFLLNMFFAYDEGYSDLSLLQAELDETDEAISDETIGYETNSDEAFSGEESEPADIDDTLYAGYAETAKQIILEWFDRHPLVHNIHIQYANDIVDAEDGRGKYLAYGMYMGGEEYGIFYLNIDNGDMIMDSITDIYGNWVPILASMEQWYLEYYWAWTEESGCYAEIYSDDLYVLYDEDDIEILEYHVSEDFYVICNWDITCSVVYGDGSVSYISGISANDLIGEYGYDGSFESDGEYVDFYYSLQIDWGDSGLVVTETWRGNNIFDHVWVSLDNLEGNTLTFSVSTADGVLYETHTLTYIPAEDSWTGTDMIYIDSDDTMPFLRE